MTTTTSYKPSTDTETWKAIPETEGLYEVSDRGRVRSVARTVLYADGRTRKYPSRVLRGSKTRNAMGYHSVVIRHFGKVYAFWVHRLVLEAFVGPCPEGMVCRHLDGDPTNNKVGNLAWGSPSENEFDKVRHGTHHQTAKTHCPRGHAYAGENLIGRPGKRMCRTCRRAAVRRHDAKRRGRNHQ